MWASLCVSTEHLCRVSRWRIDGCKHCVFWWFLTSVCVCSPEYYYDQEERTDEEAEPTFSEDEAVSQKGLRRSQSVKLSRSRVRKDVSVLSVLINASATVSSAASLDCWTLMSVFLKCRHQARYGSLKIKGKKRPALSSVNYGVWRDYCCHIHAAEQAADWWMVLSACF